jgi:hypothetical protein
MDRVTSGSLEMTWDPETRVAVVRHAREGAALGGDAAKFVDALTRWIGTEGEPFGFMVDGAKAGGLDAEFRSTYAGFFKLHRKQAAIALFNLSPLHRVVADMFRMATGMPLKAFAEEQAARSWLREMRNKA